MIGLLVPCTGVSGTIQRVLNRYAQLAQNQAECRLSAAAQTGREADQLTVD